MDQQEEADAPYTLAKANGVGALQFSPALYRGGPAPSHTVSQLLKMVEDFGVERGLGRAFDKETNQNTITIVGASYDSGDDFIRAWNVSDGRSFVLVTYVCRWGSEIKELMDCEKILKSVRFDL